MLVDAGVRRPDQILAELALPAAELEELTDMPCGYYKAAPAQVIPLPTLKAGMTQAHAGNAQGNIVSLDQKRRV